MSALQLKLILLLRSIPNDDIKLRELLNKFGLIERFTPYVAGGRGPLRSDEARKRGDRRTNVSGRDNRHASGDSCRSAQLGWVSNGDSLHPPLSVSPVRTASVRRPPHSAPAACVLGRRRPLRFSGRFC